VLAYIDWVWSLQLREAHRLDPSVQWAGDLSWDECAAMAGVQWGNELAPGEPIANTALAVELYWPARPPELVAA
jgi:hypothetical protein